MITHLAARQLDSALAGWRSLGPSRPAGGWLQAIRQALGMTTRQLARRVGVTQGAVVIAERNEARQDITLATLRRYAQAMDCDVVYAIVPRRPIHETIQAQADRMAREEVARVRQSMSLEAQATDSDFAEHEIEELKRKLLAGRRSRLWQ